MNKSITLNINNKNAKIYVFILKLIENMSQQADNLKFFRHNTQKDYRLYFVFKKKKFDFDVIIYNKYYFETIQQ